METQIERIKEMLVHTSLPIGAISEKIGYAAECGFATFFKRATGMSPTEYRKRHRTADGSPRNSSATFLFSSSENRFE
ncbi:MAG: DNA-binding transcriptional regulator AraC [Pelotomaculum sp. PtaU1.Bin065]|nr:MAG: DNA-binding transcriptional regulator AraC [Pelotomaculum sp. PtaU1.Bin065]